MTAIDAGSPILARARAWERAAVERSQAASLGLAPAGRRLGIVFPDAPSGPAALGRLRRRALDRMLDEVRAELRA